MATSDHPATTQAKRPASDWLDMVRHEERRGELLTAYDIACRGLEQYPGHAALGFRGVLALARAGATFEAERRFEELGLSRIDSEDIAALHARILKDHALGAVGPERRQLAAMAASSYQRISDRNGSYFPAINAATLSLVAGNPDSSRALALEALALVEASGDESYYAVATRAEAHLLLGDSSAARRALDRAAQIHDGDLGALSTTRRQLRMICTISGLDDTVLSALAGPAVAHYCGHMIAGDHEAGRRQFDEAHAAARIAEVVHRRPVGFAYGSLAGGGDILWAEALIEAGAELHVVLPFVVEDFVPASVATSGQGWTRRFHQCLEAAVSVTFATDGRFFGNDVLFGYGAELAMGLALLHARFLDAEAVQLALWDGAPPTGAVGTAVDVRTWRLTGHDTECVPPASGPADGAGPGRNSAKPADADRTVRALLMGDIRGFSKLPDEQLPAFSGAVMGSFAEVLTRYGTEVEYRNTWGDAFIGVFSNALAAARCALDLQDALAAIDLAAAGLPSHLALRLSGHVGPVTRIIDPVLGTTSFLGSHINRTARIEPVTPPGAVYVTEAFAALLELAGSSELRCDYVGHLPAAKDYGRLRMYHLVRRTPVVPDAVAPQL